MARIAVTGIEEIELSDPGGLCQRPKMAPHRGPSPAPSPAPFSQIPTAPYRPSIQPDIASKWTKRERVDTWSEKWQRGLGLTTHPSGPIVGDHKESGSPLRGLVRGLGFL